MARAGNRRVYLIDDKIYKTNYKLFGKNWHCRYCGEVFKKNDIIFSLYNNNIKWYHKKCYDLTLYEG